MMSLPLESLPPILRDYVELHDGPGQLVQFVSALHGIKPVLDDWVRCERLDAMREFARAAGLFVEVDCLFEFVDVATVAAAVGGEQLNTTRAIAHPVGEPAPGRIAHLFLSRDRSLVRRAIASGWYQLVCDGRVMEKPWIEHERYGALLGYPKCCRRFFAEHNDWNAENTLYQGARRTETPDFLCNSLMKHSGMAYTSHMPCAFDCPSTRELASRVSDRLRSIAPALADHVDDLLARPYLVLSEWSAFGFRGRAASADRIEYDGVFPVPSNRPNEELLGLLTTGDAVAVEGPLVKVWRGEQLLGVYESRCDRFGPEAPIVVDFMPGRPQVPG